MDPQRKARAGPMALSSIKTARKSFAVSNTYVKNLNSPKEIVTVHTSTPHIEHRPFHSEQNQIYQGEVNVLSIMYCIMLQILYNCLFNIFFASNSYNDFSDTNKDIMCCKYTEDVKEVAAGFIDGTIRLFDCNTGNCTHSLIDDECRVYPGSVTAIKHRPVSKAHPITNMLLSSCTYACK